MIIIITNIYSLIVTVKNLSTVEFFNETLSVADLEGLRPPLFGRRTEAVTYGHVS